MIVCDFAVCYESLLDRMINLALNIDDSSGCFFEENTLFLH